MSVASQNTSGNAPSTIAKKGVTKRLQSELMKLMMSGNKACTAFPDGDNLFSWSGNLTGADDTVYEGLKYKLSLKFPAEYPFAAPTIVSHFLSVGLINYSNICLTFSNASFLTFFLDFNFPATTLTLILSLYCISILTTNQSRINNVEICHTMFSSKCR